MPRTFIYEQVGTNLHRSPQICPIAGNYQKLHMEKQQRDEFLPFNDLGYISRQNKQETSTFRYQRQNELQKRGGGLWVWCGGTENETAHVQQGRQPLKGFRDEGAYNSSISLQGQYYRIVRSTHHTGGPHCLKRDAATNICCTKSNGLKRDTWKLHPDLTQVHRSP
jgi:hypothetical protein